MNMFEVLHATSALAGIAMILIGSRFLKLYLRSLL